MSDQQRSGLQQLLGFVWSGYPASKFLPHVWKFRGLKSLGGLEEPTSHYRS